jgi:hypothetical protein
MAKTPEGHDEAPLDSMMSAWLERRLDEMEDARNLTGLIIARPDPYNILRAQFHWTACTFLRLIDDVSVYQALSERLVHRALALNGNFETLASRTAAATRAAGKPLREAGSDRPDQAS